MEAIGIESPGFYHLGTGYVEKREVMMTSQMFFRYSGVKLVQWQIYPHL